MEVKKEVDEVSSMFSQDTTEVSQRKHEWCSDAILNKMREIESRYKKRIFSQFIYIRIFLHFLIQNGFFGALCYSAAGLT